VAESQKIKGSTTIVEPLKRFPDGRAAAHGRLTPAEVSDRVGDTRRRAGGR
jgi:hypothetical protein